MYGGSALIMTTCNIRYTGTPVRPKVRYLIDPGYDLGGFYLVVYFDRLPDPDGGTVAISHSPGGLR